MTIEIDQLNQQASVQHGVLSREQLQAAGFSPAQVTSWVKRGRFERLSAGCVAMAGSPPTWHREVAAAALAAQPVGGASHRTAAHCYGLRSVDDDIDVIVRYPRRLTLTGVRVVRSRDLMKRDLTWVDGIPVTTPERTLCDLGLIFPEHEVMRMLRHAVATELVVAPDVIRIRQRIGRQGRNGAGVIGRCLDELPELAARTESGIEMLFLELCDRLGVRRPELQFPIVAGGRIYRLDFAYPAHRVFVEIDGVAAHAGDAMVAADGGRQNALVSMGWRPLRLTYQQLRDEPERSIKQLRDLLRICEPFGVVSTPNGSQIA